MIEARRARSSDYSDLVRLCQRSVGSGDYVLHYLREVISGGRLFLAFHGGHLVGMTNFERCIDGSGWLSMARTDPDYRRHGVALILQNIIKDYAKSHGVRTLRLWVLSINTPALGACAKGGFKAVCRMVHVYQTLRPYVAHTQAVPAGGIPRDLMESILRSAYLSRMSGYIPYYWHVVKPDARLLTMIARRRRLYLRNGTAFILSIPDYASWDSKKRRLHSEFTLLNGPTRESFQAVKTTAQSLGIGFLGGYIPFNHHLQAIAKAEGFHIDDWADHCVVMEKRI